MLVSSHVMDEAERCDRLLLMRDGAILADGTPADVKRDAGVDDVESAFLALVAGSRRVSPRITLAVAGRVLTQLRRDHRTLAMLLALPCLLMVLLWWMFDDAAERTFDAVGPGLLALFPFVVMFLVTSVTTLRERVQRHARAAARDADGQARPAARLRARLRAVVAAAQAGLAVAVSVGLLGLDVAGPVWLLVVVAVADAVLGLGAGAVRERVRPTEFQAVQFMPAFVVPQLLLCGLFLPRAALPDVLQAVSDVLPLSYAVEAMDTLSWSTRTGEVWADLGVVAGVRARRPRPRRSHPSAPYRLSRAPFPRNLAPWPCSVSRSCSCREVRG